MKKIAVLFFALLPFFLVAQTVYVSDPIPVAESTFGSRAPRITLLGDGTPLVYWGKSGAAPHLYVARLEGSSFSEPVLVPIGNLDVNLWSDALGPQLASSGDKVYVVYEAYGEGIFCSHSTDGGQNFSSPVSVVDLPSGRFATLPCVMATQSGNPIVGFITTNSQEGQALYEVAASMDGGLTFSPTTVANEPAAGEEVCECCPGSLTGREPEEVFLSFRNNDNNLRDIWVSRSSDGALSFDVATDVDDTDWVLNSCPSSGPQSILAGDSLYAVFFSGGSGTSQVYLSSLDPGTMEKGQQWTLPHFPGNTGNQNYPRIAGQNDTLAVVWQESVNGSNDIMMGVSITGAAGVGTNAFQLAGENLAQKNPDIAYGDGIFHVVYVDQATNQVVYRQVGFSPFTSVVNANIPQNRLNAYPNPFHSQTTIELPSLPGEMVTIQIWSQNGARLQSYTTQESKFTLFRNDLPNGLYWVEIQHSRGLNLLKLVTF